MTTTDEGLGAMTFNTVSGSTNHLTGETPGGIHPPVVTLCGKTVRTYRYFSGTDHFDLWVGKGMFVCRRCERVRGEVCGG